MFLDSDDELDRNACRAMVRAIETTGADFVSGLCVRVHTTPRGRKEKPWYRWIYRQTRVLDSLTDDPDPLVWDTLATNKCYRRSFLLNHRLRFPTGIAYGTSCSPPGLAGSAARRPDPQHGLLLACSDSPSAGRSRSAGTRSATSPTGSPCTAKSTPCSPNAA